MENETQLLQLAQELGLNPKLQSHAMRPCWVKDKVNGIKFELECTRGGQWRLIIAHGDTTNNEIIRENYTCGPQKQGVYINCQDFDELELMAYDVQQFILDNELGRPTKATVESGVTFENTNFSGYGERDFMAAIVFAQKSGYASVLPSVGSNLGFEHVLPSTNSRIDAVEFNEVGQVITVIECQSGIQNGSYLDDEHFAKAISRYPQSAEICETVRKIVVIAGGYTGEQLATFNQLPYEILPLVTKIENGQIILEKVS